MIIYTNNTKYPAIVTIKVESTDKPSESLEIGSGDLHVKSAADVGVHDFVVDGGKQLRTANNTSASFLAVRGVS